jgi:hypothetical protein
MKPYGGVEVQINVFLTLALVGGEWSVSRPGRFTPEKEPAVPIEQETLWAPEPVWTTWKSEKSRPHRDWNFDPSAFQPVASRYTDCAKENY